MKKLVSLCCAVLLLCAACQQEPSLEDYGQRYQANNKDLESLQMVVNRLEYGEDTAVVRAILGEPIDFGFDYRYLLDSIGPNGCAVGAVFHIDDEGKIGERWIGEICE